MTKRKHNIDPVNLKKPTVYRRLENGKIADLHEAFVEMPSLRFDDVNAPIIAPQEGTFNYKTVIISAYWIHDDEPLLREKDIQPTMNLIQEKLGWDWEYEGSTLRIWGTKRKTVEPDWICKMVILNDVYYPLPRLGWRIKSAE